jgi:hypothetical protein
MILRTRLRLLHLLVPFPEHGVGLAVNLGLGGAGHLASLHRLRGARFRVCSMAGILNRIFALTRQGKLGRWQTFSFCGVQLRHLPDSTLILRRLQMKVLSHTR